MTELVVMLDKQLIRRFSVKSELTVGRNPKCDICLPDRTISNQHMRIKVVREDCLLEDLNSTNGTYVNHHVAERYLLKNGDIIGLGKYHIIFRTNESIENQLKRISVHPKLFENRGDCYLHILNGRRSDYRIVLTEKTLRLGSEDIGEIIIEYKGPKQYLLHNHVNPKQPTSYLLSNGAEFELDSVVFQFCLKPPNAEPTDSTE